ncbi:MAG: SRPBCC family protein [Aeromicrobium sp.]
MRLEEKATVAAPPAAVWAAISDPLALGRLSADVIVDELEPGTVPGVGARYRVLIKVGAVPVGGNIEIIEYTTNLELTWTTLTGVDHRMRFRIREAPDGSRLTLRFGYDSPGILGSVADVVAFVPLRRTVRDLLDRVVIEVERGDTA